MERKIQIGLLFLLSLNANMVVAEGLGMAPEQAAGLAAQRGEAVPEQRVDGQLQLPSTTSTSSTPTSTSLNKNQNIPQFGESYGPVRDETLWNVARKLVKNTNYSIQQAADAIEAKNPQAFRNGNKHQIKKDAMLTIPTREEMTQISSPSRNTKTED